ncbi:MAG: tetratricopeptide repeat protein [Candidatus Delongbacteria bacterium]|nr:tetratricopeptide repeat protein [Candidatus Delongbacteria bacterium]MBN2833407.1 tetratricopeptide repeat protein [Candidatus Delongbacteria bacterium]
MNSKDLKNISGTQPEEMEQTFAFMIKYKNHLFGLLIAIGVLIVGYNYYQKSVEEGKVLAQNKFYEISKLFSEKDFDEVITKGPEYASKLSGYDAAAEINVLVAKSYFAKGDYLKAIESSKSVSSSKDLIIYAAKSVLASAYINQFMTTKDSKDAVEAAKVFESIVPLADGMFADDSNYNAAYAYFLAGNKDKAKSILEILKEKKYDVNPKSVKDKVEDLLGRL